MEASIHGRQKRGYLRGGMAPRRHGDAAAWRRGATKGIIQPMTAPTTNPNATPAPRKRRATLAFLSGAGAATIAVAIGALAINALKPSPIFAEATPSVYRQLDLFGDVFSRVRANYVTSPDDADLIESALNGMLTALDPHSSYLAPTKYREMRIRTRGRFGGLGIEFTIENRLIRVITPIDDTPAQRAGILAGDLITHLNGDPITGMTLDDAVQRMRGTPGTQISLTVRRGNRAFDIDIVRAIIHIRAVKYDAIDRIAYIRITAFNENTDKNLERAVNSLNNSIPDGPIGYIIDLRNNPGGLLEQAVSSADAFLNGGEIVSTRGRAPHSARRHNARPGQTVNPNLPIIVLINGGAASASEILAGALQDHRRAILIGTRSFGKGSVQTISPLPSGGALKLTTALYYTPSGRSIQAEGVAPDILVEQPPPEDAPSAAAPRGESRLARHIENPNSPDDDESGSASYVPADREQDVQLNYALDLLNRAWENSQSVQ